MAEVEIIDERRLTIPRAVADGYDEAETEQIGKFIVDAAQDGYSLASVQEKKEHSYRGETYFGGVILTFRKKP